MGLKDKFSKTVKSGKSTKDTVHKEAKKEFSEDKKLVVGHAKRMKELWRTKETVQLKTDAIAILWNKRDSEAEFFAAFDEITKEGYRLVWSEVVKAINAGPIAIQIGTYYYFQHRDFIK